ncbi:MAG: copper homeostasis membrane protein CopD [Alphaproteobacteria bacterium]|nr:copper homeostasis membrane protein CopD [Alphaproteobacteria bacterium]
MTIEAGLGLSRFVHFAALTILFGVSLFPAYAFGRQSPAASYLKRARTASLIAVGIALLSAASWLAFTGAAMQDDIAGAIDPETLYVTLTETTFGMVWLARLPLLLLLAIVIAARDRKNTVWGLVEQSLAAAALTAIALTGHTQMQEGKTLLVHIGSDVLHLLAAGAWLGGISALLMLLGAARTGGEDDERAAATALQRFSPVGYLVVATLIATGVLNSLFMFGKVSAVIEAPYGRWLLLKLALFAVMLALAASNRFSLVPKLDAAATRAPALRNLTRTVTLEQFVGLGVLAVVAILGMTEPPV